MPGLGTPLCAAALFALLFTSLTLFSKDRHTSVRERDLSNGILDSDFAYKRNALLRELTERRRELLPYYAASENDTLEGLSEEEGHQNYSLPKSKRMIKTKENDSYTGAINAYSNEIGCNEIRNVTNVEFLGSGYTKAVLKGVLSMGLPTALKSVNMHGTDMRRCLEEFKDVNGCYQLVAYKLRKEIILLQKLQHPNIIKLQGHCQGDERGGGVTAALEQGSPLQMIQLLQSPWEERFRVCLGLVRLLGYLARSTLGSVSLLDFQPRQFVLVSGELKLTDLDDATAREPSCRLDSDCVLGFPLRNFSFPCASGGICRGLNERRNLYNAYRYFFTYLLPHQAPPALMPLIDRIMNSTGELKAGVDDTLSAFEEILRLYKSGRYMEKLPSSLIRGYAAAKRMRTAGGVDYRCWPSYNNRGCVLSVHSAREAALICSSRPECNSFTLGGQKTWTGRLLASFRSGFSSLVPDVKSVVYVKKTGAFRPTS